MLKKAVGLAAALLVAPVTMAEAAVIDLTLNSLTSLNGATSSAAIGTSGALQVGPSADLFTPLEYQLTVNSGTFNFNENHNSVAGFCGSVLTCQKDGLGINNDELTAPHQTLTIDFSREVWIDELFFLDLFPHKTNLRPDGSPAREQAVLTVVNTADPSFNTTFIYDSSVVREKGGPLQITNPFRTVQATQLVFSAFDGIDLRDDRSNDYAVAGLRVSDIGVVPVPAALPLLLTGLAALGLAARKRKSASRQ